MRRARIFWRRPQARRPRGGGRPGHRISKPRCLAGQVEAYCADDLGLKLGRHANAMADRLAAGLAALGVEPVWPVEANEVFVALPARMDARLKAAGAIYYPWRTNSLPHGIDSPGNAAPML